ncbi:hypothetical protein HDV63DRAFT_413925 [Trichoderma sp. SZMC 28014]
MACSARVTRCRVQQGWLAQTRCRPTADSTAVSAQILASARSPAPASTLTPTPRVRHAAQAVQLESYLDYGASRSAEVGVRLEHPVGGSSTACVRHWYSVLFSTDCGGEVARSWYAAPTRATPAQAQSVRARFRTGGVIGTYRRAAKGPVAQVRATSGVRRGA